MQNISQVAVNGNAGAWTVIRCTMVTTAMQLREDGSVTAQGIQYSLLREPFNGQNLGGKTTTIIDGVKYIVEAVVTALPGAEPVVIAGYPGDHPPYTAPLGGPGSSPNPVSPGGPVTLGTPVVQVRSATATGTTVNVTEWSA